MKDKKTRHSSHSHSSRKMASKNGDDYKRKRREADIDEEEDIDGDSKLNMQASDYVHQCISEKQSLGKDYPVAVKLLDAEIDIVQKTGRIPNRDLKYANIFKGKPIKLSQKCRVPIREYPKFNFVGKLLGPKGNSLKRLQDETLCKIIVLGRNSMKDRAKEEELRASMDPKYAHLNDDLHVEISTYAPAAEAYARMAYALAELRKYLTPDSNDEIRQEQLRELLENPTPELEHKLAQKRASTSTKPYRPPKSGPPEKEKVLSLLEKARNAMDETYGRPREEYAYHPEATYDYSYAHTAPPAPRPPYEATYEYRHPEPPVEYSRSDYYAQPPTYPDSRSHHHGWKSAPPPPPTTSYSSSMSRRHEHEHYSPSTSSTKHAHSYSSRDARYKSAPYPTKVK